MTDPDTPTEPASQTYVVHFTTTSSCTVKVEVGSNRAEGPTEDQILDAAYEELPPTLCIHCSGGLFMRTPWSLELGDEWEPEMMTDEEGNELEFDGKDEADRD